MLKYYFNLLFLNFKYLFRIKTQDMKNNINLQKCPNFIKEIICSNIDTTDRLFVPEIVDNFKTIRKLVNTEKSFIRYGDGEFFYMEGIDLYFQKYEKSLGAKLKQIFYEENEDLLIGALWIYYTFPKGLRAKTKKYILKWFKRGYRNSLKFYNPNKCYYSSFVSIVFSQFKKYNYEKHYNNLRKIWDGKKIIIVTGDRVYSNIKYDIFDNAAEINYLFGPTVNAYNEYEELKNKILKIPKDNMIVFALGPCGKALAYDAFKSGYRVLDFGHLIKDYDAYKKSLVNKTCKLLKDFFVVD